jgi:hypothetical protein
MGPWEWIVAMYCFTATVKKVDRGRSLRKQISLTSSRTFSGMLMEMFTLGIVLAMIISPLCRKVRLWYRGRRERSRGEPFYTPPPLGAEAPHTSYGQRSGRSSCRVTAPLDHSSMRRESFGPGRSFPLETMMKCSRVMPNSRAASFLVFLTLIKYWSIFMRKSYYNELL